VEGLGANERVRARERQTGTPSRSPGSMIARFSIQKTNAGGLTDRIKSKSTNNTNHVQLSREKLPPVKVDKVRGGRPEG
jgi:hypothetical protein